LPLTRNSLSANFDLSPQMRGEVKNYNVQPPSMMWATPVVNELSSLAR